MRDPLAAELATAELNLSQARHDEVEVEKVLDFAENLLLDTAGVWQRRSLEQKQPLQQVLFPVAIEYADGVYRTQEMSFLFKAVNEGANAETLIGSRNGCALEPDRNLASRIFGPSHQPTHCLAST